jgi:hypothetical protein|nr:MAG TPA: hypothetical protein [Caudoviricetes sp.]
MDELTVNTIPESTESVTEDPARDPDDWSDIDFSDLEILDGDEEESQGGETQNDTAEPEADQQEGEAEAEAANEPTAEAQEQTDGSEAADQPELIELKHLGQTVRVTPEQLNAYAQMGLDYQRIREDRDAARKEVERLTAMETFLKELAAPQGISVEDLIDGARAEVLAKKEHLNKDVALQRIKLDRERKAFEAQKDQQKKEAQAKSQEEAKRQEQFLRFARTYPKVKPNDIPKDVWDAFKDGEDLVNAYARFENRELREKVSKLESQLETAKKNSENKRRSAGSQRSAGSASEMDEFDRAWYDGT